MTNKEPDSDFTVIFFTPPASDIFKGLAELETDALPTVLISAGVDPSIGIEIEATAGVVLVPLVEFVESVTFSANNVVTTPSRTIAAEPISIELGWSVSEIFSALNGSCPEINLSKVLRIPSSIGRQHRLYFFPLPQ